MTSQRRQSENSDFCATDIFPRTFNNFRFMVFTEAFVKDLARMLTHVRKIFNCGVSCKMLLLMCPVIVEKAL